MFWGKTRTTALLLASGFVLLLFLQVTSALRVERAAVVTLEAERDLDWSLRLMFARVEHKGHLIGSVPGLVGAALLLFTTGPRGLSDGFAHSYVSGVVSPHRV